MNNWKRMFPIGYEPRKLQTETIEFALKTFFEDNKKFCIIEAPV